MIEISAFEEDESWRFCVADNGSGIDPKYHLKIFEMFQSLESVDEGAGTGVGLALIKKIVDLHGGNVWVESAVGKGSKFFFTLSKVGENYERG